jgi:hypothetical protein
VTPGSAPRCLPAAGSVALVLAGLAVLTACTTSGHAQGGPTDSSVASTPAPSSSQPATPTPAPTTSAPVSSSSATTSASPSPRASTVRSTCTSVTVRVVPGGATPGQQIAGLEFTNSGSKTCVLAGYPTVKLLLHGTMIGQPSQPSRTAQSVRTLRPGDTAESLLHDYTQTCQAPLSDSVQVQVPGRATTAIRPDMQLRACTLQVDPLRAPD